MNNFKEKIQKEVIPAMQEKFGYKNKLAVPKIEKVTLNVGISANKKDDKFLELVENTLTRITGQKPVFTKARMSVSSFKIREGNVVGAKVTLRKQRMNDFVEKLINITLPRVRDFRGLFLKSIDRSGNLTIGFKENLAFAEINPDEVEKVHGLEIVITTSAKNKEEGTELLKLLGFPFKKK
ncbi:MAG: 50S ribosomal protein L5 [Patescibacteria group bacterium]